MRLVGFRQRVNGPAAEPEHGATSAPVENAGGRLLFAVVSHGHKDDGLTVFQGRVVNPKRLAFECPTALQHPQRTRPKPQSSAFKVEQTGSFAPAEHIDSSQVEACLFQLAQTLRRPAGSASVGARPASLGISRLGDATGHVKAAEEVKRP